MYLTSYIAWHIGVSLGSIHNLWVGVEELMVGATYFWTEFLGGYWEPILGGGV